MKKRLLSVILCAAMAVSLMAGCGKTDTTEPTPTTAPTQAAEPTEAPEPTKAPEPTEAPAPAGEALPEPVYYFDFETADGLSPRMNGAGSSMDERVYLAEDKEFAITNGVKGNCLWLDGTFGAQVDAIEPLNSETYTISFWTWASRLSNYSTTLQFGNGMATGATEHWLSFTTLDASTSYPCIWSRWQPETGNVQPWPYYEDGAIYGRKKWAHFCLVVDETEVVENSGAAILKAQLYIDGVPSGNEIQVVPGVFTGDKATTDWRFLIGVNPWDKIFKGAMDELYIFDEALTPGQVATLYADGDGSTTPELSTLPEPEVIKDYSNVKASGTMIGTNDGAAKYGDFYSEIVEVPEGTTATFKFKNYVPSKLNAEGKNVYDFADTYSLILQNVAEGHSTADNADYKEYAVISGSEGYEAAAKLSDLNVTRNTFNQFNPKNFISDSDLATYTVSVTNYGTTAKVAVKASCADGVIRYTDIEEIPVDGPLYYTLTTAGSFIDIAADDEAWGIIVGNDDCSSPFWGAHSEPVKVEVGETAKLHFKNYSNGVANWNNYVVVLQNIAKDHAATETNGYKEYAVVRADNYGWGDGYATAKLENNAEADWAAWLSEMNGADVILEVTNHGATADVVATVYTKSGNTYYQKYLGITIDGDLYYCLTVDGSYVEILGTPVGNIDNSSPFWGAHSEPVKVEVGETERVYFKNYSNGVANWNNYVVVLQNIAKDHAATETNGYKEYAVVRSDNYGWGDGYATAKLENNAEADWATWLSEMNGADVVLDVTNHGTTADVVATVYTKSGSTYYQKYLGITIDGDLYYCLTVDGSFIDIVGTTVGSLDNSAPFWGAHSEPVKVEVGETANVKFRNYSNGISNWNNYVVVLQNIAKDHAATDTNGYKEYAVVRADNYGWGDGYATAKLENNAEADWATWLADMNGALVDLYITNHGTTADVVANVTAKNGNTYYQKYIGITIDGDLYYCLTVDGSSIKIFE